MKTRFNNFLGQKKSEFAICAPLPVRSLRTSHAHFSKHEVRGLMCFKCREKQEQGPNV